MVSKLAWQDIPSSLRRIWCHGWKRRALYSRKNGIYAGQHTPSCFQIHQRMVSKERHQRRPLDDWVTCLSQPPSYWELLVTAEEETLCWRKIMLIKEELVEWDGGNYKEIKEWCGAAFDCCNGLQKIIEKNTCICCTLPLIFIFLVRKYILNSKNIFQFT